LAYETGRLSSREFYEAFCSRTGARPDYAALFRAFREIFSVKVSMLPVIGQLARLGCRMGILSNTCQEHWDYCRGQFAFLRESFCVYALSFEIGACKPDPAIFAKAAELAGCRGDEIFYTDDMPGHVAGGRAAGFDAVVFTSAAELAAELRRRGVPLDG
jgi:FMN phosphatase YigB (HAD superfamily)